jgi:hypothetical protein
MLTEEHLNSLAAWAASGAEASASVLRETHTEDSGLEVRDIRVTTLSDLPDQAPCFEGECVAGVASRFEGGLCASALLAMDPEDALAWVRSKPGVADPLEAFVRLGETVQSGIAIEIGAGLGLEMRTENSELREESVPLILFGTHAPSDTVVVVVSLLVASGDEVLPVHVYLMIEPKLLGTALAA